MRSKMEAKSEDGPEMDVDGATPEGQNGKKLNIISSCKPLVICFLYVKVLNITNSFTVITLYHILIISHSYLCNSVQSLVVILSDILHASILLSPYIEYFALCGVHMNIFRHNRYRE